MYQVFHNKLSRIEEMFLQHQVSKLEWFQKDHALNREPHADTFILVPSYKVVTQFFN